jgi:hypothetical protein
MDNLSKRATVLFLAAVMATLLTVESASALSTPKPSVPEVSFSVTDNSYDVETSTITTVDPYDGRVTATSTPGYHRVNGSITLSIKNQPFTPYYNSEGYPVKLYYCVRARGIDTGYWNYFPGYDSYFPATNSTYTHFVIGYLGNCFQTSEGYNNFRTDGTLDFQVQAFIGYMNVTYIYSGSPVTRSTDLCTEYVGQTSNWSNPQTVTLPNASYTPVTSNTGPTAARTSPTPSATYDNTTTTTPEPLTSDNQQVKDTELISLPVTTFLVIIAVVIGITATSSILIARKK